MKNTSMKSIMALMAVLFLAGFGSASGADIPHDGSPTDSHLRFIGRWDRSQATVARAHWAGAYIRMAFTGTSVKVRLEHDAKLQISMNGTPFRDIVCKKGLTTLTREPLSSGEHTLVLTAQKEVDLIHFQGFELDTNARTLPIPERPIIEFVGDSISVSAGTAKDWSDSRVTNPFAWRVTEMLGVDCVLIAKSGAPLVGKPGMSAQYFKNQNFGFDGAVDWQPTYSAAVVVINLGANDTVSGDIFTSAYSTFIQKIRALHPKADIVALRPFGASAGGGAQRAALELRNAGDDHLHFVDTAGWLEKSDYLDGVHPSTAGSLKAATKLKPVLESILEARKVLPVRSTK